MSPSTARIHELAGQSLCFRFLGPELTDEDREAFRRDRKSVV